MDRERWLAVRGMLFAGLALIAALAGGTIYAVFDQAARAHGLAVDRCHDAGGAWVAAGAHSYAGQCLLTPSTPARRPAQP